jgi:hypothetical protein
MCGENEWNDFGILIWPKSCVWVLPDCGRNHWSEKRDFGKKKRSQEMLEEESK